MSETEPKPDARIDITDDVCPMTFVRVKLALERLPSGALLDVRLNDGEPLRNVPRSAHAEGHEIVRLVRESDGSAVHRLLIRRA
ncbi:MAG: sulfurtransferase TusA family protein [Alphaproteobacteria bacterium]|nr:sulfurtransferase TusA family protein [Alphaproteobacteria bacterium]